MHSSTTSNSWSRPTKHAVTPPPLYLTKDGEESVQYCKSCGRVMSKPNAKDPKAANVKYCSDGCRSRRTNPLDRRIEETFVALLDGADPQSLTTETAKTAPQAPLKQENIQKKKPAKGDKRILVQCDDVELIIFGSRFDPAKTHGRKRNKAKRTLSNEGVAAADMDPASKTADPSGNTADDDEPTSDEAGSVPSTDDEAYMSERSATSAGGVVLPDRSLLRSKDGESTGKKDEGVEFTAKDFGAGKVRPGQLETELNFSAMGGERGWAEKIEETDEMREKRLAGERRAREREQVRRAARRLVAFGWPITVDNEEETSGKSKKKNKKGRRGTDDEDEEAQPPQGQGQKTLQKKCEAIMGGVAVEASFAKGPFGIRWREYKSGPLAQS